MDLTCYTHATPHEAVNGTQHEVRDGSHLDLGSVNTALEKLTGILISSINGAKGGAPARCTVPERGAAHRIKKAHGLTFRSVAVEKCAL